MIRNSRVILLSVLWLGFLSLAPFSAAEAAKLPPENERLLLYLKTLQTGTFESEAARNDCISLVYRVPGSESFRKMIAGFLQEPTTNALVLFCELLVEAVSHGKVSPETVNEALRGHDKETQLRAAGILLRTLYFVNASSVDPLSANGN